MSAGSYADFFKAVGMVESGDNYGYVSPAGYLGYYQFSTESLQAAGFYNGANSASPTDFSTGTWTGLAASYGVTDVASFLSHPAAQDAAATAWFQAIYGDLTQLGLLKYAGQTLDGFTLTPSALLAGSHLIGAWNLQTYLNSGGDTVPTDGGGETVTDYMSRLTGYDTPFSFQVTGAVTLTGGSGNNALHGFAGDDSLVGGGGANTLMGGDGNDTIQGGPGFNQVNGNTGDDVIIGHSTVGDWLSGGQGQDSIDASASTGHNILNGNLGDDTLIGGSGGDTLRGGQGDDVIHAGSGNDWISGDFGNNTLYGGQGADTFHAGAGHDVVSGWHAGDHIQVDSGVQYTVAQVNGDVHVTFSNGGEMDLIGVRQSSLQSGWIA